MIKTFRWITYEAWLSLNTLVKKCYDVQVIVCEENDGDILIQINHTCNNDEDSYVFNLSSSQITAKELWKVIDPENFRSQVLRELNSMDLEPSTFHRQMPNLWKTIRKFKVW